MTPSVPPLARESIFRFSGGAPRHGAGPGAVLWLGLLLALAVRPMAAEAQALNFGDELRVAGCLRVAVLSTTDRSGDLGHDDWVTLRVRNDCPESRRHLLVALFLIGLNGEPYGRLLWLLQRGEVLKPGASKIERYPIPDPDNRLPRQWALRVISVQKPRVPPTPRPSP